MEKSKPKLGPAALKRKKLPKPYHLGNFSSKLETQSALRQYSPGSHFSGVYNSSTGKWVALPSDTASLINKEQIETVTRAQGHLEVERTLGQMLELNGFDKSKNVGFSFSLKDESTLLIKWKSTSINLNNFSDRQAPKKFRAPIIRSIENETGCKVIDG